MATQSVPTLKPPSSKAVAIACALTVVLSIAPLPAGARTIQASPENYRELVRSLAPGDRLELAPGIYARGLALHEMQGRVERPITISGPEGNAVALFVARAGANTISLVDAAYIVIRNLTLDGRNLPVDGVKAEGNSQYAHHITLENLHIIGHGNNQQIVGISTKCPAWGWVIRGNVIEGAGTGMYLGNSNGAAPFWAGLIEANQVVDSLGYDLQIKHQSPRPNLDNAPAEPAITIIRNNLFGKSRNASAGVMARPNVLLGHWPLEGPGQNDRYVVYGNWFVDNPSEALFQAEGQLALYGNVFINPSGDAVHIQPHNDIPRDMAIFNNTVWARDAGIVIRDKPSVEDHYSQRVDANLIAATRPLQGGVEAHNLTMPFYRGLDKLYPASALNQALLKAGHVTGKPPKADRTAIASELGWDDARPDPVHPGALSENRNDSVEAYLSRR